MNEWQYGTLFSETVLLIFGRHKNGVVPCHKIKFQIPQNIMVATVIDSVVCKKCQPTYDTVLSCFM